MPDRTASPRRLLLQAFQANLRMISQAAGYRTDMGAEVTLEPGQLDPDQVDDGLTVFIQKQERPSEAAVVRTHRLTTVALIVKRKAYAEAESRLDDVLDDIEDVLTGRAATWPKGYSAPVFMIMEPLRAPAGADWIGAHLTYTTNIPIR